ncbi:hypothetical protein [Halobaculum magnesiiphilum]|uniref:Uncharacterized protein n=1 Tax=Halobaculum magnesiiphilum TaxID=1017351 RepID=A0A8T8WFG4_9EURY|nr:hypothetical protein [Halobaculum magnesiiphilum]QZP38571.1 hypothetical protein K6T50_05370 [Halobaculum magnesiiphilum]
MSTVKLSRVESLFEELEYPISRAEAAGEFGDTTVLFADGEGNLGRYISECPSEQFRSEEDLYEELQLALPIEAVGEPGQSEGDA